MNIYRKELENEIVMLNSKIIERRKCLAEGLKSDLNLTQLRPIYLQIKDLEKRLDFCFAESHALRNQ